MSHSSKVNAVSWRSARPNFSNGADTRLQAELDVLLRRVHRQARLLFGATTRSDPSERQRLVGVLANGGHARPNWVWKPVSVDRAVWHALSRAKELAEHSIARDLYLSRLDEIDTELLLCECLGQPKLVRPMAARLFGTGAETAFDDVDFTLVDVAHEILARTSPEAEELNVPPVSDHGRSVQAIMLSRARRVGLQIAVRVDPGLIASAAVGERTVFIADRLFGEREADRLAVHEVYGHLVSAFNGRTQVLGILAIGTAGSYATQEGVAIHLEERAGLLDPSRRRTLAARLLVTQAMHSGASFGEVAKSLVREHGFHPSEAIALCERSFRGGGVARDAVYLRSWLQVRRGVSEGVTSLSELQLGKVALRDVEDLRRLAVDRRVGGPVYLSNFARSFGSTGAGTSSAMSPPSLATSFTRFDAT